MAWQLYLSEFYKPIAEASPHAGHVALARLEKEMFGDRCTVVTMNVDGLHSAAGSSQVLEVHGTVNRVLCRCRHCTTLPPSLAAPKTRPTNISCAHDPAESTEGLTCRAWI